MKVRLNMDVTPDFRDNLKDLAAREGISVKEIIKRSLALYEEFLDERDSGTKIIYRHKDGSEEVVKLLTV